MRPELLVLVPTRGRPGNARRLIEAFRETCTAETELSFLTDEDDPEYDGYRALALETAAVLPRITWHSFDRWLPMCHKLNQAALSRVEVEESPAAFAFMGDDHLPRTRGWDDTFLDQLYAMRTGIVYGNDRLQFSKLCSAWAITRDLVKVFGGMTPAPVEHLYCDNAVLVVGDGAECMRYIGDVVIEHLHPFVGRAEWDDSYRRINSREQDIKDGEAFRSWVADRAPDLIAQIRRLREDG